MNLGEDEHCALKHSTRVLIEMVGTLDAAADCCRVDRSRLSKYQAMHLSDFMPVDVVYQLQHKVGETPLTDEVLRLHEIFGRGLGLDTEGLHLEAMDVVPAVGRLIEFIRHAKSDHSDGGRKLTEAEKRKFFSLRAMVDKELHDLDAAVRRDSAIAVAAE